jgi:hypothetical protein
LGLSEFEGKFPLFSFLEILKNLAFAEIDVIHYSTRNYKNKSYRKLRVKWAVKFQTVHLHKKPDRLIKLKSPKGHSHDPTEIPPNMAFIRSSPKRYHC